jgi:hypothetical protein
MSWRIRTGLDVVEAVPEASIRGGVNAGRDWT